MALAFIYLQMTDLEAGMGTTYAMKGASIWIDGLKRR